jgi:glycosyltransferase 2 family protein
VTSAPRLRRDRPVPSSGRRLVACVVGVGVLGASARAARHHVITPREDRYFRASNRLPDVVERPLATVMQFGSLAGSLALGAAFALAGRPRAAIAVSSAGAAAWGAAKLVKRQVGRGRPDAHLEGVTVRGRPQTGLGFPSGHTSVAVATVVVASRYVQWPSATLLTAAAATTGVARMYVGAHLPLDVAGGFGLGLTVGCFATLLDDQLR